MDIVLVHPMYRPPAKLLSFYDGHTVARNGIIRIAYDGERSIRWAKNAYLNGYRSSPDGTLYASWDKVQEEIDRQRSAESADVNPDSGTEAEEAYEEKVIQPKVLPVQRKAKVTV